MKYGDGAENDWFTFYTRAAELKAKAMIKMFQGSGTDAVLYKAWHDSTPQLQEFVLSRMPGEQIEDDQVTGEIESDK